MNRPTENSKYQRGNKTASKPGGRKDRLGSLRRMLRHHDDEDRQNGDRADVDENLRQANELRAEVQIEGRKPGKTDGQREHAMNQIAEHHRSQGSGDRDGGKDEEGLSHVRFDEFSNVVPTLSVTDDQIVTVRIRSAVTLITN